MNIPTIVDIAISLIFIYLILSLLASEIQELISTLLQWRAVHLKESIEGLLAGDSQGEDLTKIRQLSNQIYENPLIKGLNQEAKGFIATMPRRLSRTIGSMSRWGKPSIFGQNKYSGPSFISSQVFASSLLSTLKIPELNRKITGLNTQLFLKEKILNRIAGVLEEYEPSINRFNLNLKNKKELSKYFKNLGIEETEASQEKHVVLIEFYKLRKRLDKIISFFDSKEADLVMTVDKVAEELENYIQKSHNYLPSDQILQIENIKQEAFGNNPSDRVYLLRELQPNISELLKIIWESQQIYDDWKTYKNQKKVVQQQGATAATEEANQRTQEVLDEWQQSTAESQSDGTSGEIQDICNEIQLIISNNTSRYEYNQIVDLIEDLETSSVSTKEILLCKINEIILRYQENIQKISDNFYREFKQKVGEESLSSTPKKVLIIMAFLDSVHQDKEIEFLEQKITQILELNLPESTRNNLALIAERTQTKFEDVREDLNKFEAEVSSWFDRSMERASGVYKRNAKLVAIIIGFIVALAANADTLHMFNMLSKDEALRAAIAQTANNISSNNSELTPQAIEQINSAAENLSLPIGWGETNRLNQLKNRQGIWAIRYIFGWSITAIAISMGSSFWYGLLGKIIDVRNVGKKPQPSNE